MLQYDKPYYPDYNPEDDIPENNYLLGEDFECENTQRTYDKRMINRPCLLYCFGLCLSMMIISSVIVLVIIILNRFSS